ncbi:MAG: hypothetical protein ACKVP0_08020 [Pirellulaceae bacterium]
MARWFRGDVLEGLAVHAVDALVGPAFLPGFRQHVTSIDLVVQTVETELGVTLGFGQERCAEFL